MSTWISHLADKRKARARQERRRRRDRAVSAACDRLLQASLEEQDRALEALRIALSAR